MLRMRMMSLAAVLIGVAVSQAEMPSFAGNAAPPMMLQRGHLFAGANWWTRYGEPVNAVALTGAESGPIDKGGPMPAYGDGYAYGPGTCDCSPPCISGLWAGYYQNPKRCHFGHHCARHCGYGACGGGLFGHHCGRGCGCGTAVSCGAATPSCAAPSCGEPSCGVPSCGSPVTCGDVVGDCGCKPVCGKCRHFHHHAFRGFMAHWNCGGNSCSTTLGCGCAVPACGAPSMSEKQATGLPTPMPEDAAMLRLPRLK